MSLSELTCKRFYSLCDGTHTFNIIVIDTDHEASPSPSAQKRGDAAFLTRDLGRRLGPSTDPLVRRSVPRSPRLGHPGNVRTEWLHVRKCSEPRPGISAHGRTGSRSNWGKSPFLKRRQPLKFPNPPPPPGRGLCGPTPCTVKMFQVSLGQLVAPREPDPPDKPRRSLPLPLRQTSSQRQVYLSCDPKEYKTPVLGASQ